MRRCVSSGENDWPRQARSCAAWLHVTPPTLSDAQSYFRSLNINLRFPQLGCVRVSKVAWYPLECVTVLPVRRYSLDGAEHAGLQVHGQAVAGASQLTRAADRVGRALAFALTLLTAAASRQSARVYVWLPCAHGRLARVMSSHAR